MIKNLFLCFAGIKFFNLIPAKQCDIDKFIKKGKTEQEDYVCIEDTYDVIQRAPMATGHGGRDRMMKHLGTKHANITREAVCLFKSFCSVPAEPKETNDQRGCCEANPKQRFWLL